MVTPGIMTETPAPLGTMLMMAEYGSSGKVEAPLEGATEGETTEEADAVALGETVVIEVYIDEPSDKIRV